MSGRGAGSESVVRERLVGFRHAVCVFAFLHRATATFRSVENLAGQTGRHRLLAATARVVHEPAHGQRLTTRRTHFDRNLIRGTANATRLHFDVWRDGFECFFEHFDGIGLAAFADAIEGTVHDPFSDGFLAADHHV